MPGRNYEFPPRSDGAPYVPPPSIQPPPLKRRRIWPIVLGLPVCFLIGLGIGAGISSDKTDNPPKTLPTVGASTPAAHQPKSKIKTYMAQDGTYLVGENIAPGTYRNGGEDTDLCVWERLKGTGGNAEDIITGGVGPNQVVTIAKTDRAFKVQGCGPWVAVTK